MLTNSLLTCKLETPLGTMLAAAGTGANAGKAALCGLWFIGQKYFPKDSESWLSRPEFPLFLELGTWIDGYFSKSKNLPCLSLAPCGTPFQLSVWKQLIEIPCGTTCTYGGIAKKLKGETNNPVFVRAVAGAVGRNPISLIIPCHRVIGSDGTLKGYAGGIERKMALLELEGIKTGAA